MTETRAALLVVCSSVPNLAQGWQWPSRPSWFCWAGFHVQIQALRLEGFSVYCLFFKANRLILIVNISIIKRCCLWFHLYCLQWKSSSVGGKGPQQNVLHLVAPWPFRRRLLWTKPSATPLSKAAVPSSLCPLAQLCLSAEPVFLADDNPGNGIEEMILQRQGPHAISPSSFSSLLGCFPL